MSSRIENYLSFAVMALPVAAARRADVVVAMTDPPFCGTLGMLAGGGWRRPFLYWVQDLHPDLAVASGLLEDGTVAQVWRRAHRVVLGRASTVVVLGQDMAERAIEAGARPPAVRLLRPGAPLGDEPDPSDRSHPVATMVRSGRHFVVVHAGNLGFAGAWDTLLAAAPLLGGGVGLSFVGAGADAQRVRDIASELQNVAFYPYQPPSQARFVLAAGDLHVVTIRRGLEGLVVPSKLYGILAAGRPALVVADERSDAARLVREHHCGIVADPDSPKDVVAAIRWGVDHPAELEAMGRRARALARNFSRPSMLRILVEMIEECRL